MKLSAHFDSTEFTCKCGCGADRVSPDLIKKLESLHGILGRAVVITSGVRCPKHNAKEGGKPSSAHLTGEAADVKIESGEDRFQVLFAALAAGFHRIGIANGFIHVDVSETLPGPTVWTY